MMVLINPTIENDFDEIMSQCASAESVAAFNRVYNRLHALESALFGIDFDFMTSEAHHPGYVLIPSAKFEALCAAKTGGPLE